MTETPEHRLKRLRLRSMRRGIKEMDVILSAYADARLAALPVEMLDLYEDLLTEADLDVYQWVSGQSTAPEKFRVLVSDISQTFQK